VLVFEGARTRRVDADDRLALADLVVKGTRTPYLHIVAANVFGCSHHEREQLAGRHCLQSVRELKHGFGQTSRFQQVSFCRNSDGSFANSLELRIICKGAFAWKGEI